MQVINLKILHLAKPLIRSFDKIVLILATDFGYLQFKSSAGKLFELEFLILLFEASK